MASDAVNNALVNVAEAQQRLNCALDALSVALANEPLPPVYALVPTSKPLAKVDGFETFWALYPRRTGKGAALKAWNTAKPDLEAVKSALSWQVYQASWGKDGGAFIPHPATWLNQRRWEDEPMQLLPTSYQPPTTTKSGRTMAAAQAALERL
jgi:hypothetical protein